MVMELLKNCQETVSAEFVGSQEVFLLNPVTGTKNPEYETGNVYVAGVLESIPR